MKASSDGISYFPFAWRRLVQYQAHVIPVQNDIFFSAEDLRCVLRFAAVFSLSGEVLWSRISYCKVRCFFYFL